MNDNFSIKNYIPELWCYLIKVKLNYYQALSHFYSSFSIKYIQFNDARLGKF